MSRQNDLLKRIRDKYNDLSKGQKLLANYITLNYEKAVFLTASKLGNVVGVSESTVVRFAVILGYDGYPKFQKALEELVKNKLNTIQRMEVASERIDKSHVLKTVLQADAEKIKMTLEDIDEQAFEMAVDRILSAKKIYIMGARSSALLASFLYYYFNIIFENVKLINTNSVSESFEQLYRINDDDLMIGISFPRYSQITLKSMDFAKSRGVSLIALTDSYDSPMAVYSDCNLIAKSDMASIVDSLTAPLSVINALIVAICIKKQEEVIHTFKSLEEIWSMYQIYESSDSDK